MEIETVVMPNWIYDFADYQQMYDLTDASLPKKMLDFSAGTSSFNREAHDQYINVVSVDVSYNLLLNEMRSHADQILFHAIEQLRANPTRLRNSSDQAILEIVTHWKKNQALFVADYSAGKQDGRYQSCVLPKLPYETNQFNLALCTDYIFYHAIPRKNMQSILRELARVAEEVRVFPLLDGEGKMPAELGPLMLYFQQNHFGVEVREVPYRTLKGGNAMLRIWEQECHL